MLSQNKNMRSTKDLTKPCLILIFAMVSSCSGSLFTTPGSIKKKSCEKNSENCAAATFSKDEVESLFILPVETDMPIGKKQELSAVLNLKNGKHVEVTNQTVWESKDIKIAALDLASENKEDNKGTFVSAIAAGRTEIVGKYLDFVGSAKINVLDVMLLGLEIEPKESSILLGKTQEFFVQGIYSDGKKRNLSDSASWVVSNPAILSLEANSNKDGMLGRGLAKGETTVTASFSDLSASAQIKIIKMNATKIIITPSTLSLEVGLSKQFSARAYFQDGTDQDVTELATWTTTNSVVAVMDTLKKGQINAKSVGPAKVDALYDGKSAQGSVTVVSVPVAISTLTVNGSSKDLTLNYKKTYHVAWTSTLSKSCTLKENTSILSPTATSGDQTRTASNNFTYQLTCLNRVDFPTVKTINLTINHDVTLQFDPGTSDFIPGTSVNKPLAIYFLLDVTGSMSGQINNIKDNIVTFVDKLVDAGFNPKVGLIPFDDEVKTSYALTSNIADFQEAINKQKPNGGVDGPEGGLLAIKSGISRILAEETRADAVKVLFLITDNFSHQNGNYNNRDCTTGATKNAFNALSTSDQQSIKFFFSAPSGYFADPCSRFTNPYNQLSDILNGMFPSVPRTDRGDGIAFPFTAEALNTELVAKIQTVSPRTDLVCLAERAFLNYSTTSLISWTTPSRKGVYAQHLANDMISVDRTLNHSNFGLLSNPATKLEVSRCCVSLASAQAGSFGSCVKSISNSNEDFTIAERN